MTYEANDRYLDQTQLVAAQKARRAFLSRAGRFAAYTPPLMLGLLLPGPHAIASGWQRAGEEGDQYTLTKDKYKPPKEKDK